MPVLAVSIPFTLDTPPPSQPPPCLSGSNLPVTLSTTFTRATPEVLDSLKWALSHSDVVDIDIQSDIMGSAATSGLCLYDSFEELLAKATAPPEHAGGAEKKRTHIVLSKIAPFLPTFPVTDGTDRQPISSSVRPGPAYC